jgi:hypothetical protein
MQLSCPAQTQGACHKNDHEIRQILRRPGKFLPQGAFVMASFSLISVSALAGRDAIG